MNADRRQRQIRAETSDNVPRGTSGLYPCLSALICGRSLRSGYGSMDRAGGPCARFGDEAVEEGTGGRADVIAALGMPLNSEDEVRLIGGQASGSLAAFYRFDDSVLGTAGGDAEAIAGDADGLMVAGVDGEPQKTVLLRGFFGRDDGSENGIRGDGGSVGDGDAATGGVVDRHGTEVLDESAASPDVKRLRSKADGQNGLVEVVSVLDEKFVYVFAGRVCGTALGDGLMAIFVRVYVGRAAGKQDRLAGVDEVGGLFGGDEEGDFDGMAAGFLDCFGINGPGKPVVFGIGAGGERDGYARLHGSL